MEDFVKSTVYMGQTWGSIVSGKGRVGDFFNKHLIKSLHVIVVGGFCQKYCVYGTDMKWYSFW